MSSFLKLLKLSRSALVNHRLANIQRSVSVAVTKLQKFKGNPIMHPVPKEEEISNPIPITPAQRNLLEFVTGEILAERHVQMDLESPCIVDGFTAHFSGSLVELIKETSDARINIFFNVSKSVPRECEETSGPCAVRSVPKFEILIKRNGILFSMFCEFKPTAFEDEIAEMDVIDPECPEYEIFDIKDLSLYRNGWSEDCFAIDASLLDENLQILIQELLEEMGITHDFVRKLSDLATTREHALYIEFLENLSLFTLALPDHVKKGN